jgi:predicted lipid-binding transport protein (Tim44 family)
VTCGARSRLARWLLGLGLLLAPLPALARAGDGGNVGSRGSLTYSPSPPTDTAPGGAVPIQRSQTPPPAPSPSLPVTPPPAAQGGGPAMSGVLGGLVGAGIGGLLLGRGMFEGVHGPGGVVGLLLQVALIVFAVRWVGRRVFADATTGGGVAAQAPSEPGVAPIGEADMARFEQLLVDVQAAWSTHDLAGLRLLATPEMVSIFADQLAEQTSRGVRNVVSDVRVLEADLAEAWAEDGREYATVALRFALHDVTLDAVGGHVLAGDPEAETAVTEIWTFLRVPGGRWVLCAIQQANAPPTG